MVGLLAIVVLLVLFFSALLLIVRLSGKPGRLPFGDKIAVVEIQGVITQSSGVIEEIHQHLADEGVKAIILTNRLSGRRGRALPGNPSGSRESEREKEDGYLHGCCGSFRRVLCCLCL